MSVTQTIKTTWSDAGSTVPPTTDAVTADAANNLDPVINNAVTDQAVAFAVDHAKVQLVWLSSDAAVTIKTNSSTSPTDTIALTAGIARAWTINEGIGACPFSASVTGLFISNASGKQANVKIRCLYNL